MLLPRVIANGPSHRRCGIRPKTGRYIANVQSRQPGQHVGNCQCNSAREQDGKELPSGRIFSVRENLLGEQPAPLPP
jgi:hypothetical protein